VKRDIHPVYATTTVICCVWKHVQTRSVRDSIHLDVCSNCDPFFTGKQKLARHRGPRGALQTRSSSGRLRLSLRERLRDALRRAARRRT